MVAFPWSRRCRNGHCSESFSVSLSASITVTSSPSQCPLPPSMSIVRARAGCCETLVRGWLVGAFLGVHVVGGVLRIFLERRWRRWSTQIGGKIPPTLHVLDAQSQKIFPSYSHIYRFTDLNTRGRFRHDQSLVNHYDQSVE